MVKNSIQVYGRIKRSNKIGLTKHYDIRKNRDSQQELVFNTDTNGDFGIYRNSKHRYRFSKLFDQDTSQTDIFDNVAKPVINSVLQGYNGTIFAYGQTGSGKTFSMTGSSEYENRGIIPRTIQYIFEYIENSTNALYNIYISYLEIYNEVGYDLLNPRHRATYLEDLPRVTLLEDAKGQTHLRNLGVISVASEREAMCLLFLGDTNRTIAETPMNLYSSRSHCIFTVHFAATMTEDGRVRRSKLHLVDLAGSERIQKSTISGTLLIDAKQINLSLHYLEQVIIALSDSKRAHVPYRNSMMTTVLKDSLGGNCLTAMLATLSIEPKNFEETISTCKFAQRVALITSEAIINEEEDPYVRISELKLEVENLKKELILYKDPNNLFQFKNNIDLTTDQIKDCEKDVATFLKGSINKILIDGNINKVNAYFNIFKKIIITQSTLINNDQKNIKQINSFQDQIKEKEKQISQLRNMLNTDPQKTKGSEEILTNQTSNNKNISNKISLPHKEAFEVFLRQDQSDNDVAKCGSALKLKMQMAKQCADKIQTCKENIINLKKKLRDNINNTSDITNKLMSQLKLHQEIYRENILKLYNLKREATHLSHGFQQAKRRVLLRFKDWWEKKSGTQFQFDVFSNKQEDNKIFSPKNSTDYFLWDPDLSSLTAEPKSFQNIFATNSFTKLLEPEYFEKILSNTATMSPVSNRSEIRVGSSQSHTNSVLGYQQQPALIQQMPLPTQTSFLNHGDRVTNYIDSYQSMQKRECYQQNSAVLPSMHETVPNQHPPNIPPMHRQEVDMQRQYYPHPQCQSEIQFKHSPIHNDYNRQYEQMNYRYSPDERPPRYINSAENYSRVINSSNKCYTLNYNNYDIPEKLPNYIYDFQPIYQNNNVPMTSMPPRPPHTGDAFYVNQSYSNSGNPVVYPNYYENPKAATISREQFGDCRKKSPENPSNIHNFENHPQDMRSVSIPCPQESTHIIFRRPEFSSPPVNQPPCKNEEHNNSQTINNVQKQPYEQSNSNSNRLLSKNNSVANSKSNFENNPNFKCSNTSTVATSTSNSIISFENNVPLDICHFQNPTIPIESKKSKQALAMVKNKFENRQVTQISSQHSSIEKNKSQDSINLSIINSTPELEKSKFEKKVSSPTIQFTNNTIFENSIDKVSFENINKAFLNTKSYSNTKLENNTNSLASNKDNVIPMNTTNNSEIHEKVSKTTQENNRITNEYLNSIPLTGDPEVDEEILAFYRTKQTIINKNNE